MVSLAAETVVPVVIVLNTNCPPSAVPLHASVVLTATLAPAPNDAPLSPRKTREPIRSPLANAVKEPTAAFLERIKVRVPPLVAVKVSREIVVIPLMLLVLLSSASIGPLPVALDTPTRRAVVLLVVVISPAVEIDQLSSVMETLVADALPMAMVLATAPVPMLMVLALVAPVAMETVVAPVPLPIKTELVPVDEPKVMLPV